MAQQSQPLRVSVNHSAKRSVLVTGGASGIGLAIAQRFIAQGLRVLITGSRPRVPEVARALSTPALPVHGFVADLADTAQVLGLAQHTRELFDGGCDILVNCAGVSQKRNGEAIPATEVDSANWNLVLHINLTAPFLLARELIPAMRERGWGRIVNISSRGGRTFNAAAGVDYATSKAAMLGMTRHLAGAYGADGITVNSIAPGRILTPLSNTSSPQTIATALKQIPVGRLGEPDDIAGLAEFLASDDAGFITGTCIDANGGAFMV